MIAYRKALTQSHHAIISRAARSIQERRVRCFRGKAFRSDAGPGPGAESFGNLNLIDITGLAVPTELNALRSGNELDAQHAVRISRVRASQEFLQVRRPVTVAIDVGRRPFRWVSAPVQTLPVVRQAVQVVIFAPRRPTGRRP